MACTRSSVLNNPEVKKKFTWRGSDLPALHETVMKRAGEGYMAYRTIPQFPPIGDRVIIALTAIASGQTGAADGMKALQRRADEGLSYSSPRAPRDSPMASPVPSAWTSTITRRRVPVNGKGAA